MVNIDGAIFFDGSWACGTVPAPAPFFGFHCFAPAGLVVSSHSVLEEVLEEVVAPLGGRRRPGDFEAARDGVGACAGLVAALPSEPLLLEVAALRLGADVGRRRRTVGLAERVPAGDERHRFLVVHRHAAERLANVPRRRHGIGLAIRPFRVHVDEAHLHRAEGIRELPIAAVALVTEPRALGSPVDVLGLPDILAAAGETKGLEPHRLEGDVAGQTRSGRPRRSSGRTSA